MDINSRNFLKDVEELRESRVIVLDKEIVDNTGVSAGNLSSYLSGKMKPSKPFLTKFYNAYGDKLKIKVLKSSIDKYDLNHTTNKKKKKLNPDNAAVANMDNVMYVPLVNQYAYGGYLSGYADEEYVQQLTKIPFMVDKEYRGKYMCFEVRGDSMDVDKKINYSNGDIVLGREIQRDHWRDKLHIDEWPAFVIVHQERGIIIKQITAHNKDTGDITCHSFNSLYDDFVVNLSEVVQLFNVIKKQSE